MSDEAVLAKMPISLKGIMSSSPIEITFALRKEGNVYRCNVE